MKNYFSHSFYIVLALVGILSIISIIAPQNVFGVKLKQTNIYSDIVSNEEIREMVGLTPDPSAEQKEILDSVLAKLDAIEREVDSLIMANREAILKIKRREAENKRRASTPIPQGVVALEDFSIDNYHLAPFFEALEESGKRNVRIAFLGDSFIEGDIMTADLREMFQLEYGGAGVGFMPITSQVAKFRGTIKHDFSSGWKDYVIINNKDMEYGLSGHSFQLMTDNGWVEYTGNNFRKNLNTFERARLLFVNQGKAKIKAIIDDTQEQEFKLKSSPEVQSIEVKGTINKVRFEFENAKDIVVHGALLDNNTGISIDNYSVRGNSGLAMSNISQRLCAEMNKFAPYDMIVLEYGLNVVNEEATHYGGYRNNMVRVVQHIQECYPGVPIVIMGVSERSMMEDGEFIPMPGVAGMDSAQRDLAKRCAIVYWSTVKAMRSLGGMEKFVEYGWAAKDYTHIGTAGGRKIAQKMYEAIMANR